MNFNAGIRFILFPDQREIPDWSKLQTEKGQSCSNLRSLFRNRIAQIIEPRVCKLDYNF